MNTSLIQRLNIQIRGAVQGVGFRPFIYRLAREAGLSGWVSNTSSGVRIEIEGPSHVLSDFLLRIECETPPHASIHSLEYSYLDAQGYGQFEIRTSEERGEKSAVVMPDIATCSDCLSEIFDPENRRYLYPFTNCTHCGPRFSIIEALPYDRVNTSMREFRMCLACQREYENPADRRFHAQPNACSDCGPHLELWNSEGNLISARHAAVREAVASIRKGEIIAVKGLGGFHLMVDGRSESAVKRLRHLKRREEKPFAIMFPSIHDVHEVCEVSRLEERTLSSPESPIVLLRRKQKILYEHMLAPSVAPKNPYLGAMLPYTPLHHILMANLSFPVVATSGNLSDETICFDEKEAITRLGDLTDKFLVHNRRIVRHVDDSIVRVILGREQVMRRARGFAPLPIHLDDETLKESVLALGPHMKNSIALGSGQDIFLSQHIGDLDTEISLNTTQNVARDLCHLYEADVKKVVCDLHPDYRSTHLADSYGKPVLKVQHHYAHVLSCMAENDLHPPVLGVAWDGSGFGLDGTVWGGELLSISENGFDRFAHLRTFSLPGGEQAVIEPRRTALGLLFEIFRERLFEMKHLEPIQACSEKEQSVFLKMLHTRFNCPRTSSAGRLFDAVASIIGMRQFTRYEGQAAMDLEFALPKDSYYETYPFRLQNGEGKEIIIDWAPMIKTILDDYIAHMAAPEISLKFHNTLVEIIVAVAKYSNQTKIVLSGGCFQNRYLTERAVSRLEEEGLSPYWHQRVPPNDGGIALGQVYAAVVKGGQVPAAHFKNREDFGEHVFSGAW